MEKRGRRRSLEINFVIGRIGELAGIAVVDVADDPALRLFRRATPTCRARHGAGVLASVGMPPNWRAKCRQTRYPDQVPAGVPLAAVTRGVALAQSVATLLLSVSAAVTRSIFTTSPAKLASHFS
jgi:hypothetical protein